MPQLFTNTLSRLKSMTSACQLCPLAHSVHGGVGSYLAGCMPPMHVIHQNSCKPAMHSTEDLAQMAPTPVSLLYRHLPSGWRKKECHPANVNLLRPRYCPVVCAMHTAGQGCHALCPMVLPHPTQSAQCHALTAPSAVASLSTV
jgi:hypothetical protein